MNHQCEPVLTTDEAGWTSAICQHLGIAACAKGESATKESLRVVIDDFLGSMARRGEKIPQEYLDGTALHPMYEEGIAK